MQTHMNVFLDRANFFTYKDNHALIELTNTNKKDRMKLMHCKTYYLSQNCCTKKYVQTFL